jgi:hypothetical protein
VRAAIRPLEGNKAGSIDTATARWLNAELSPQSIMSSESLTRRLGRTASMAKGPLQLKRGDSNTSNNRVKFAEEDGNSKAKWFGPDLAFKAKLTKHMSRINSHAHSHSHSTSAGSKELHASESGSKETLPRPPSVELIPSPLRDHSHVDSTVEAWERMKLGQHLPTVTTNYPELALTPEEKATVEKCVNQLPIFFVSKKGFNH